MSHLNQNKISEGARYGGGASRRARPVSRGIGTPGQEEWEALTAPALQGKGGNLEALAIGRGPHDRSCGLTEGLANPQTLSADRAKQPKNKGAYGSVYTDKPLQHGAGGDGQEQIWRCMGKMAMPPWPSCL